MKRQNVLIAAGLALVAVALMQSCGGNSGGTNPYTKTPGDTTNAVYQTARAEIATSVGYSQGILKDAFTTFEQIAPDVFATSGQRASLAADTLPIYDSVSQYWIRTIVDTLASSDPAVASYVDSVQFLEGTTVVKYPDSTRLTSVKIGSRWRLNFLQKADSQSISLNAVMVGQPHALTHRGDIVVNGSGFWAGCVTKATVSGPDTACNFVYAFSLRHQDLHINIANVFFGHGCPSSGLAKHAGVLISDCHGPSDSLDYEKQWTSVTTYDGQYLKFTIENPSTRWVFQTNCSYISAPGQPEESDLPGQSVPRRER